MARRHVLGILGRACHASRMSCSKQRWLHACALPATASPSPRWPRAQVCSTLREPSLPSAGFLIHSHYVAAIWSDETCWSSYKAPCFLDRPITRPVDLTCSRPEASETSPLLVAWDSLALRHKASTNLGQLRTLKLNRREHQSQCIGWYSKTWESQTTSMTRSHSLCHDPTAMFI